MNSLIGDRIKILRLKQKLTQEELAKQLGVNNKSSIANYEAGYSTPKDDIKIKMCELFNCSMDYLMGLSAEPEERIYPKNPKSKIQQILELADGLSIQEANYLIKQFNKAKIQIEEVRK